MKHKKYHRLLGLNIRGEQVCFIEVDRVGDRLHVRRVIRKTLPFTPLTADPVLAGGELRKMLEEAGVRTRQCVVNLPLPWVMVMQSVLPDLPEADIDSYLALQAEREFPCTADDLCRQSQRFPDEEGIQYATTLAVSRQRIDALLDIVRRARLKPVSLTLGISQLSGNGKSMNAIAMSADANHLEMAILAQGKLAGLRSLDHLVELNGHSEPLLDTTGIVRQLRLTLAQLPESLRSRIHSVNIYGPEDFTNRFAGDMRNQIEPLGLEVLTRPAPPIPFEIADGQASPDPTVLSSAASYLLHGHSSLEFMPEHVSKARLLIQRVTARGTILICSMALAVVLAVAGAYGWQYRQLTQLETRWAAMEPHVKKVEQLQEFIRTCRPWFDDSVPSLRLLKQLTEAFPERGDVWVKSLDVKELTKVTCSGFAINDRAWLTLHDKLLTTPGISLLEVQQVRGNNPVQFNFTYQWDEVAANGL